MSIIDFGRRLVRYFRLVRAVPRRVAQLPELRADLAEQSTAARAGLEQLRADLAEQSTAARAGLEQLRADLAKQSTAVGAGLEQLRAEVAEQSTTARAGLEQLRGALAEQGAVARAELEQLRDKFAEQTTVMRTGLTELGADLLARTTEANRSIISEVTAQVGFSSYDFDQQIRELAKRLEALDLDRRLNALDYIDAQFSEIKNLVIQVITNTVSRFNALDTQTAEMKNQTLETKNIATYTFDQQISELANRLEALGLDNRRLNALANRLEALDLDRMLNALDYIDARFSEIKNLVIQVITNTVSRFNALDTQTAEMKNQTLETKNIATHINTSVHTRLNTLEFETISGIYDQLRELAANQFELRAKTFSNRAEWAAHPAERYKRARPALFESYLAKAKKDFPHLYPLWRERLDAMLNAFRETKTGNAAYAGDPDSRVFRSFVDMYAVGRVLDVGCGVFGRPYYLMDYPAELISGLEPLPMIEAVDFELVRGISEYLPWPDESFSTVISATSLDHCMSLKRSLDEIVRVLRPEGRFLLWIDSVPRAPAYEPDKPDFKPADQFHLFHFETSWFEPMLEQWFKPVTQTELRRSAFSRVMYCLVKK